jgi:uncharacterized BrkB/YihY/UPF0761 family membrane protein
MRRAMAPVRASLAAFWRKAYEENLTGMAAMVAYTLLLSVFPVALVALFIAGRVLQSEDVQESVLFDLQQLFPSAAESTLSEAVRRLQDSSPTTGILALVAAVWFAASFWGALDTAFCRIYHRECRTCLGRHRAKVKPQPEVMKCACGEVMEVCGLCGDIVPVKELSRGQAICRACSSRKPER